MKTSTNKTNLKAGDVVYVNLDPTRGAEKNKTRPCLVLEIGESPLSLLILVPITEDNGRRGRFFVPIRDFDDAGLTKESVVDCYQIRCLDTSRVLERVGEVDEDVMDHVKRTLAMILDIAEEHVN